MTLIFIKYLLNFEKFYWSIVDFSVAKESASNAGDPGSIPGSERSAGEGIGYPLQYPWASFVAQLVRNPPAMWETWARSLGWEDPLEKGKATHSSILAWRIPWTVQFMESQRVRHGWAASISLHVVDLPCCVSVRCPVRGSVICIYSFALWFAIGYWIQLPVLGSRPLLSVHTMYMGLHLLIPNSQSVPPQPLSSLAPRNLFCVSVSFFVDKYICVVLKVPLTNDVTWYLAFFFWLIILCWLIILIIPCWVHSCCCRWHCFFLFVTE